MDRNEVKKLLIRASAMDNRVVSDLQVEVWFEALHDLSYDACVSAMIEHWKTSTAYLQPAHLRQLIVGATPLVDPTYREHLEATRLAKENYMREVERG